MNESRLPVVKSMLKPWPTVYAVNWDGESLIELRWRKGSHPDQFPHLIEKVPCLKCERRRLGKLRAKCRLEGAFGEVSTGAKMVVFESSTPYFMDLCREKLKTLGYQCVEVRKMPAKRSRRVRHPTSMALT